ncbi:hypothetical protein TNCV_3587031 [Trichonephila clavipes]|nr:hypothetical protein TNCV_3587031 [Trichonephila clavipes]
MASLGYQSLSPIDLGRVDEGMVSPEESGRGYDHEHVIGVIESRDRVLMLLCHGRPSVKKMESSGRVSRLHTTGPGSKSRAGQS